MILKMIDSSILKELNQNWLLGVSQGYLKLYIPKAVVAKGRQISHLH